jgi:hypothetical protein
MAMSLRRRSSEPDFGGDEVQDEVGGRVVAHDDHQVDGVTQRQARPVRELAEHARSAHLLLLREHDLLVPPERAGGHLGEHRDHDRQLDVRLVLAQPFRHGVSGEEDGGRPR